MAVKSVFFANSCNVVLCLRLLITIVIDSTYSLSFYDGGRSVARNADCVIVGGGPIGLASALTLSNEPHCMNVIVLEKSRGDNAVNQYDPTRSYLYNVNSRGLQWFTINEKEHLSLSNSAHEKLQQRGISGVNLSFGIIPGNPSESIVDPKPFTMGTMQNYWIPRHQMVYLLEECCNEQEAKRLRISNGSSTTSVGSITLLSGKSVESMECSMTTSTTTNNLDTKNESLIIKCHDGSEYKASFVVGADGIDSSVRQCLASNGDSWFHKNSKEFRIRKYKSPATGLKLKALQIPPNFTLTNTDGTILQSQASSVYAIRGIYTGPRTYVSMGLLPMKDNSMIRPANVITRYDHVLWRLKTGGQCKEWFTKAFPRLPFNEWIDDTEWERFAKANGTSFPFCQYSPGSAIVSSSGAAGIALVGDACHAFPPDIGQGINAGFQDVIALDRSLRGLDISTAKPLQNISLKEALMTYQTNRKSEHAALIRLARFGSPYQYRQPWIRDKIGRILWTMNVALRLLLNKITWGRIPLSAIQLVSLHQDWSYRKIMSYADGTTFLLRSIFSIPLLWWIFKKISI